MTLTETLWQASEPDRRFVIPDAEPRRSGPLSLHSLAGDILDVDPAWAARFEVSELEARQWALGEFGFALEELRRKADRRLARMRAALAAERHAPVAPDSRIAPDAVSAVLDLIRRLPGAVAGSLSGDAARLGRAVATLSEVEARLSLAGIELGGKLGEFPSRLAALRRDFETAGKKDDG